MQHLHSRAIWLFFLGYLFRISIVVLYIYFRLWEYIGSSVLVYGVALPLLILVLIVFYYFWAVWTYNNYKYQFSDFDIKIEKGVIAKKYSSIPYKRIQNVDIRRGPVARILGLSGLQIQTAGYSGSGTRGFQLFRRSKPKFLTEGSLPGLDPQLAETLQDEAIKRMKEANRQGTQKRGRQKQG